MSMDSKAKVEEARKQTQLRDAQGNVHKKPSPPPVQTITKGAWTNPEAQIRRDKALKK